MKKCSRCKQCKPDSEFRKRSYSDKLQSHCKPCQKLGQEEYRERLRSDENYYAKFKAISNIRKSEYRRIRIAKGLPVNYSEYLPIHNRYRAIMSCI